MSAAAPAPATALVIDDEAMVRHLVRRMLEPNVCQVLEAPDGEAGLRLLERSRDGIHVVLTDLVMPGIDGYDVVEVLSAHYPHLPVACMSGFPSHPSLGRRLAVPFIPKPFDAETLRGALAPLLEHSRSIRRAAQADALDLVAAAIELKRRRAETPPTR